MPHHHLTVQIMAGGLSTRMGRDKAQVTLGGRTLLERALERWENYGVGMQLSVGDAPRRGMAPPHITAVVDLYPRRGPLGGLHAGLQCCPTELLLLAAVDCPFLTPALADGLLTHLGDADVCVYTVDGRPQPLFGLYRKGCVTAAEQLLAQGDNRMTHLLERVRTATIPAPDPAPFRNLNTPEELAAAEKEIALLEQI